MKRLKEIIQPQIRRGCYKKIKSGRTWNGNDDPQTGSTMGYMEGNNEAISQNIEQNDKKMKTSRYQNSKRKKQINGRQKIIFRK